MMTRLLFFGGERVPLISLLVEVLKRFYFLWEATKPSSLFSKHSTNQRRNYLEFISNLFAWSSSKMRLSIPSSLRLLNHTKTFSAAVRASLQVT